MLARLGSLLVLAFVLAGCLEAPSGVEPVKNFELERYLGQWYEIARLDHRFERGLEQVTANYSLAEDGGVRVVNRGWSTKNRAWKEAEGIAYFVRDSDTGHLKVSFLGPFFGAYVVFELDHENYSYAFVSGPNRDFLWLLARTSRISPSLLDRFVRRAAELDFDTSELIRVRQP